MLVDVERLVLDLVVMIVGIGGLVLWVDCLALGLRSAVLFATIMLMVVFIVAVVRFAYCGWWLVLLYLVLIAGGWCGWVVV